MPAFLFWEAAVPARIEIAPEFIADGKYLYEHSLMSVEGIAAE
jgi:hypothetical protein